MAELATPDDFKRGGVYSARDFVRSKFHSTTLNDPALAALPLPSPEPTRERLGQFELIEILGRGGMGAVYRARDVAANREVALKVTTAQSDPARVERFRREGQITASLDHPGIVRVHSAGHEEGVPWIAYELVEGQTLRTAFDEVDVETRVRWVIEAAQALGYAHSRGVVHRDVKPSNILVDAEGRARVADFGLALGQSVDRLTATDAFLGTPLFMSPEQFSGKGKELKPASDVWSLGVLLYLALSGEVPFDGENVVELGSAIRAGDPVLPREHDKTVSAELEAVCMRALESNPRDRYEDGSALAADLQLALEGQSEARAELRQRRAQNVAAVALGLIVVVLGTIIVATRPPAKQAAAPPSPVTPGEGNAPSRPARPTLDAVVRALATDELERAHEALQGADLGRIAPAELAAIRERLAQAVIRLARGDVDLDPLFRAEALLATRVPAAPNPALADAVMRRAIRYERAAPAVLADRRVLTLVGWSSTATLRPSQSLIYALLDSLSFMATGRQPASGFYERLHQLLMHLLRLEADLASDHIYPLFRQPVTASARGLHGRYLYLRSELSVRPERPEDVEARARAFRKLKAFLAEAPAERFGAFNRARALVRVASDHAGGMPSAERLALLREALSLAPDDPGIHRSAARVYVITGGEALRARKLAVALNRFEAGLAHGLRGTRVSLEDQEIRTLRFSLHSCYDDMCYLYGLLGRAEEGEAFIASLQPWLTDSTRRELRQVLADQLQVRARLPAPKPAGDR